MNATDYGLHAIGEVVDLFVLGIDEVLVTGCVCICFGRAPTVSAREPTLSSAPFQPLALECGHEFLVTGQEQVTVKVLLSQNPLVHLLDTCVQWARLWCQADRVACVFLSGTGPHDDYV